MVQRKHVDRLVAGGVGAAAGATVVALTAGHRDAPQPDAPPPPAAEVILQSSQDKKALLETLDRIAAYNRYDDRAYTEVWDMHYKANRDDNKRHHIAFVKSAQKTGDVVGDAKDLARKIRTNAPGMDDMARRFKENARELLNYHASGQSPVQAAMAEVPPEYWPQDKLEPARQQYDAVARDVLLASQLITSLKLDQAQEVAR